MHLTLLLAAMTTAIFWASARFTNVRAATVEVAVAEVTEYTLKAQFVERFTRYVKWPDTAMPEKTTPFVVAVVGKDPFGKSLEELLKDRKVAEHPIKIAHFASVDALAPECQLLFVPRAQEKQLEKIGKFYKDKPVLIVAESSAAARNGAHIGLYLEQSSLRFVINNPVAKQANLEISSELLKLATPLDKKSEALK